MSDYWDVPNGQHFGEIFDLRRADRRVLIGEPLGQNLLDQEPGTRAKYWFRPVTGIVARPVRKQKNNIPSPNPMHVRGRYRHAEEWSKPGLRPRTPSAWSRAVR